MNKLTGQELVDDLSFLGKTLDGCTLTAREVVAMTEKWWDKTGRHLMGKESNLERVDTFKGAKGGAPAIRIRGTAEVVIPSKVLQALPWAELDRRDRAAVVKAWLSQYRQVYGPDASRGH